MLPFDIFPYIMYPMKIYMSNITDIKNITELESKLSKSDMLRYKKFSNKTRRLQYLLSRAMVIDACGESIIVGSNGKPTIKSGFISIAHKDNWVVVAISNTPVGIDIENTDINRDFVGESELLGLPKTNDKQTFYKNFVKYEAEFKFGENANQAHLYFYTKDNYLIGVCSNDPQNDIHFVLSGRNKNSDIK